MNKKPPERCSVQAVCRCKPCEYTAKNMINAFQAHSIIDKRACQAEREQNENYVDD